MRLSELQPGKSAIVVKTLGHGAFRHRLVEMGFVRGQEVTAVLEAPLRDPVKYRIMHYEVSLRLSEARLVEVEPIENIGMSSPYNPTARAASEAAGQPTGGDEAERETSAAGHAHSRRHTINVALIGNPNSGKTSLFNMVSGAREHVGNYSGVTVDAKEGSLTYKGYKINVVDLPGTYSLTAYSPEELYVRRYLTDETPDVIVNVVAASNLKRNLYLTTELIDMNRSMVIALNMYDELERSQARLDYKTLGAMIGVPIVPTSARHGDGINNLLDTIIEVYEDRDHSVRHIHIPLQPEIDKSVDEIRRLLKRDASSLDHRYAPRYLAIKLLEGDKEVERLLADNPHRAEILQLRDAEVARIEKNFDEEPAAVIADDKYGFISGALAETLTETEHESESATRIIDTFVTNKLFGFPIFLVIMFFIFWATFYVGAYPMEWLEWGVDALASLVNRVLPDGIVKDLIADGVIGGVGGVIVFLPNILILYFCISFMEDSGYMARAAFIMDRLMHRIGLHGKSFIPLVMGFGCNVPAIMSARAIESPSSRLITILINPFMSCSARVPIYVLLVLTFFPNHPTLVFMGLYLTGILVAMATARLLRRFVFKEDETPFVMELPPYRLPTLKASLRHTWGKGRQYLRKMGGIILVASIVVWALNYFPIHDGEDSQVASVTASVDTSSPAFSAASSPTSSAASEDVAGQAVAEQSAAAVVDDSKVNPATDSYLEMLGKAVNPIMEPLGFNWRATVAAVAGIPAKEIVVSTLGVLYTGQEEMPDAALAERLKAPSPVTGRPGFTMASALAFMVFILLYCPCIATVTAIVRETGSWRYGAFSILYNTAVAWAVAWLVYRLALLFT